jgi:hypothetical protein
MWCFIVDGPAGRARVIYNDPRRFGYMDLIARGLPIIRGSEASGWSRPATAWKPDELARRLAGKAAPLKAALLDQRIIAGLGNIYVCEALWRARTFATQAGGAAGDQGGEPRKALERLTGDIRDVIGEAIAAGGSSLRDHIQTDGTLGYFQHGFSVYDREGKACPRPGCGDTVRRIVQGGRSTFMCAALPEGLTAPGIPHGWLATRRQAMALKTLKTETRGRVAIITLNRPDALNALNSELLGELRETLAQVWRGRKDRRDRADRIGKGLRRWRRHQGNAAARLCRRLYG